MAGFPLMAIGAGIGQGVDQIMRQRQQQAELDRIRMLLAEKQQEDQSRAAAWQGINSGGNPFGDLNALSGIQGAGPPMTDLPRMESPAAPMVGRNLGGGLRAGGALRPPVGSPENERITDLIIQDESGGRNIRQQVVGPQGGYNPSVGRVTGPSSAQGIGQFTDPTWREAAAAIGAGQYAHAMDAPLDVQRKAISQRVADKGVGDWAPYNKTLARHLGLDGGGHGGGGADVPPEVRQTAMQTASTIPQEVYGRMSLQAMARQIESANPGASPVVKMMALERMQKLMAPSEQRLWDIFKLQHADMWKEREFAETRRTHDISERRADLAERKQASLEESRGWDILTDPTNQQQYRYNKVTREATTLSGEPYKPGGAARIAGGQGAAVDPKSVDYVAKKIASYDMAPMSGWALRSKFGQDVMAKVAEMNPEYDQTKYQAKVRGQVAFTTGKQGDAVRAFSVAIDHLATLEDVAHALAQNDTQRLNQLQNVISKEFGYVGLPDFNLVKTIVGSEVSKATIGGIGALKDREELRDALNAANSPEQLLAVVQQAKRLMAGQLGGFRRQAGSAGFTERDFEAALSPRAKAELEGLPGGAPDSGSKPASQPQIIALPDDLKSDPDGTSYEKDGTIWVKRGNQLVETPGAVRTQP